MIKITNLNKSYGDKKVLENLNCTIKTGSVYGLIGANGAGKSTLLRIIMGIFKKDSGVIEIDGKELVDVEEIKQKLVYVPDDLFFFKNSIKSFAVPSSSVTIFCMLPPSAVSTAISYSFFTVIRSATTP